MLVAPGARRYREMSREPGRRVGAAAPRRKRARAATREAFDVKKEVFAVSKMSGEERKILRERFQTELVAVRGLLEKAEFLADTEAVEDGHAAPSSPFLAAPRGEDGLFLVSGPRSEEPMEAERAVKRPKMTPAEREQLAFRLASLSAELSAHAIELLQKRSRHGGRGEIEVDIHSLEDAALLELKLQLDKFVKTRNPSRQGREHSKIVEQEEEDQDDECAVNICGGVSPLAIALSPLELEILEYRDIFGATGVEHLLSPLQQKYVELAEKEEEYVDICGDASPVVIQNLGEITGSTGNNSSSDSDSDSDSDSGSDSSSSESDSGSDSDSDVQVGSSAPAKVNDDSARSSEPVPEVVQDSEAEKVSSQAPAVLSQVNDDSALPSELALEVVQNAEPENVSSPAPAVLSIVKNDDSALPSELAPEVVQNAEPENVSSPAPAVLSIVKNDDSALPLEPAPEVVQGAELDKLPAVNLQRGAAPPARPMSELIAKAQERRRHEERSQAREKARQELVEVERAAMASDMIRPMEMAQLGIAGVEHIVSPAQPRVGPAFRPSLLQQLGLFLKAEDDGGEEQQQQASFDPGVEDLEEGEIR